jgi:TorA maturation chaperone TorD
MLATDMLAIAGGLEESKAVGVVPEDETRAVCYGLFAHLFSAPPSSALLGTIAQHNLIQSEAATPLGVAWRQLQEIASDSDPARLRQEYDDLFAGVGKPEIMLQGCYYLTGFLMEKPLAKLRDHLDELGFARRQSVAESEDHISALCEVMRVLIAGYAGEPSAPIETQHEFFLRHIAPWAPKLAAALEQNKVSTFYAHAGKFIQAFFQIEHESFEIA